MYKSAPMIITLFTDASVCRENRIAAYAIWAKCDGRTIRRSGLLTSKTVDSSAAELGALVNGVYFVIAGFAPPPASKIIAQTDSGLARFILTKATLTDKQKRYRRFRTAMDQQVAAAGIELEVRLVKGHQGHTTTRSSVNTWCDREAKRVMRAARAAVITAAAPSMVEE